MLGFFYHQNWNFEKHLFQDFFILKSRFPKRIIQGVLEHNTLISFRIFSLGKQAKKSEVFWNTFSRIDGAQNLYFFWEY